MLLQGVGGILSFSPMAEYDMIQIINFTFYFVAGIVTHGAIWRKWVNFEMGDVVLDQTLLNNFCTVLDLQRQPVGIRFLFLKEEYDDIDAPEPEVKCSFCALTARAMRGEITKAHGDHFQCQGGPEMLGMKPVSNYVRSGCQFSTFRLYEDRAVARQVQRDLSFVDQKIYGVLVGPLSEVPDADVVMLVCNAWQMMRIVQGYTYHNGMAKQIGMIGNQGICADLVARPYQLNDFNLSMLCSGARANTGADDGEVGAGMPRHIFEDVAKGVIATVNAATENNRKKSLIERLDTPEQLGFEIELGKMYGSYAKYGQYPEALYKKELF